MALTDAELGRARQAAAEAPPLTPERRERLRAILAGCVRAQSPESTPEPQAASRGAADAA
jgi:hypothetical protein